MRLSLQEINAIKESIALFDPDAKVYLFGSRVHDDLKGGDIDLLIFSDNLSLRDEIKIKLKLYDALGEQKIDLVRAKESNKAFTQMVLQDAILL